MDTDLLRDFLRTADRHKVNVARSVLAKPQVPCARIKRNLCHGTGTPLTPLPGCVFWWMCWRSLTLPAITSSVAVTLPVT